MPKPKKKGNKNKKKQSSKWIIIITIWTFFLAIGVSIVSESIMRNFSLIFAFITLIIIVSLGVIFDIIGIAVTASDEKVYHAMAANKVEEAKYATRLVRNASSVSSFCNDVIGDICGIISGAAGTIIVMKLINKYSIEEVTIISIIMSGFIASLTVGGKAFGKEMALKKTKKIVIYTSRIVMFFNKQFGIDLIPHLKNKKR